MTLSDCENIIRPFLSERRYQHCVNVAQAAKTLAERCGADTQEARKAGLLHDIMKETPPDEQLKIMEASGIILTNVERGAPKLWHAMAGAAYLERELHIADRDLLNAVRYHTTGRAGMSVLEKIIFVADFISAERDYDGVEGIRAAAQKGLESAVIAGLAFTLADLAQAHKPIHPDTFSAYNDVLLSQNRQQ